MVELDGDRKGSNASLVSGASKASRAAKSGKSFSRGASTFIKKGFTMMTGSRNTTASVADIVDFQVGDRCESVSLVTMRREEDLESEVLAEIPVGTCLEVLELGMGRRVKIGTDSVSGWISSKTKQNEPLIMKRQPEAEVAIEDFEVGGQHEVKSMVTMRAEETLDSDVITEVKPGAIVKILEIGALNKRRAKVSMEPGPVIGWISLATKQGELLIGKVSDKKAKGMFGANTKVKTLLVAARSGDLESVKKIAEGNTGMMSKFSSKPNLNGSDIRGKTALIYAAAFGHRDIVAYLLTRTKEVDVNALDDTQKTALHHGSKRARTCRNGEYADRAQSEIITMLLQAGSYLEARDHNGCTSLMFAVANGDDTVVATLLTLKAAVNVKDFEGHTALEYARNFKHRHIAQVLKDAGAVGEESDDEQDEVAMSSSYVRPCPVPGQPPEPAGKAAGDAFTILPVQADEAAGEAAGETQFHILPVSATAGPEATTEAATVEAAEVAAGSERAAGGDAGDVAGAVAAVAVAGAADGVVDQGQDGSKETEGKKKKAKDKDKDKAEAGGEKPAKGKKGGKADTGKKGKKDQGKRVSSAGMMEAVEVQEEDPQDVRVEADHTEEVDEKKRSLDKLAALLESSPSPGELEASIKVAKANGAEEADLEVAEQTLKAMKARQRARDRLRKAADERDPKELREAIAQAEETKVPAADVEEARRVLKEEEPKEKAREQLKEAKGSGDTATLKAALAKAKEVGLPSSELAECEDLLAGAESKDKAEEALKAAIAERSVASLKFAIKQASDAGVDAALIESADAILKVEEPRLKARERLTEVCDEPSVEALQEAIEVAKTVGLEESEYSEAVALLEQIAERMKALDNVKEVLASVQTVEQEIEALREAKDKLSAAVDAAIQAGVAEVDLREADIRRKKLHNAVEDLKGSIRVYCRVRPLSSKEKNQGDTMITEAVNAMTLKVEAQEFQFDSVWTPGTQEEVFEDCRDLVQSAVDGYNVTMFAYGQTGAGKTFTMYGAPGMEGTAPRTIKEIFQVTDRGKDRFSFTVMGSMLELYRNDLVDLLSKGDPKATKQKLNVRQEKTGAVIIEHLTEEECQNAEELSELLERGNSQRTVAATAMNSESSRSHLVLLIRIVSVNKETKEQMKGKILIVDLAGSERLKKSQVEAHMQKEAIEINKSLTALGDVIEALTKGSKVIPYRNHKLTQLMQDSLGGTAKTLMFVNCSPANSNVDETLMSLKYATRAKKITNTAKK